MARKRGNKPGSPRAEKSRRQRDELAFRLAAQKKLRLQKIQQLNQLLRKRRNLRSEIKKTDEKRVKDASYDWNAHYRRYEEVNRTQKQLPKPAARSARTQSAPHAETQPRPKWKSVSRLALLNEKRRETRNSWTGDPCVKKPNSSKAAKIKHSGKGKGGYEPRKWC